MAAASGHLRLVHGKRGRLAWYAKYRTKDGRQIQKKIGLAWTKRSQPPEGFLGRGDAEAHLRRLLEECDRAPVALDHTMGDAAQAWLRYVEHEKRIATTTLRRYRSGVGRRVLPWFGEDTPLRDVSTEEIDEFRAQLLTREPPLAPATVRQDLMIVSGIVGRAVRSGWLERNPFENTERVRVVNSGDFAALTVSQVEAVVRSAGTAQDAVLFEVAAYTGLRPGELRALRWRDVDFGGATLHVRRNHPTHGEEKVPKGRRVRSVPLTDQAARAFESLSRRSILTEPDDRVFLSPTGGPIDSTRIRDDFYSALDRASLGHLRRREPRVVFYSLRHTFGTLAVQLWPVTDVQVMMGHTDVKTTLRYVHYVPKTDAAARFTEFIDASKTVSPLCPEPGHMKRTQANSAQRSEA